MTTQIYGIDQTGAILNKNEAQPLKACELILNSNLEILDVLFFKIPNLSNWVKSIQGRNKNHIFIDCVFGLPIDLYNVNPDRSLRDWILQTKGFKFEGQSYGRKTSEAFFKIIQNYYKLNTSNYPKRAVEVELNSNSVFTTRPYQKNIQTGTFRIWKELSHVLDDIMLWPTDFYLKDEMNTILYEVYPSYFYKTVLNTNFRHPEPALKYLESVGVGFLKSISEAIKNPDYCDALVAALGGLHTLKTQDVWRFHNEHIFFEGNILGSEAY